MHPPLQKPQGWGNLSYRGSVKGWASPLFSVAGFTSVIRARKLITHRRADTPRSPELGCASTAHSSVSESNSRSAYRWTSHQINMFPSVKSDAAKKTPTASRSLARRTMRTARKATAAQSTAIRLNLRRTGSEKNEYRPENHWNARYQSQPSPAMTKHESIHHGLDRTVC